MEIIFTKTKQVVSEQEFRSMYSNTSFPLLLTSELLASYDAALVFEGEQAAVTPPYEFSFRNGVKEVNGKWFTNYDVGPIFNDITENDNQTATELEKMYKERIDNEHATNVRNTRDQLLKECDWTQISDAPVDKDAWADYRQLLRNISNQESFPYNIIWPVQPK